MVEMIRTRAKFADYRALPETNQIVELIDGEIIVDAPLDSHQKALWQIVACLLPLIKDGEVRFVPIGLHFDDGNSFEPDFIWISPENNHCFLEDNGRYWHGAPDLIIEVLLPSTAPRDRGIKFEIYEKYGVREYWMVDPEARYIEVYRHDGGRFMRHGVFVPGQDFTSIVLGNVTIEVQALLGGK